MNQFLTNLCSTAQICEREGLWHHVDGTWGAAALVSATHRHLMAGCERSDSLSWNPHKMMVSPRSPLPMIYRAPHTTLIPDIERPC